MNQPIPPPRQPGPHGASQPPGPYGQAPQPGPYGAPPQQPGPYAQPSPGYPQPAYPAPGHWGAPPLGAPPAGPPSRRGGRPWLVVGIVAVSLAGLAGLSYLGKQLMEGGGAARPFPAAEYRLTVPATLLDGDYRLVEDSSAEVDAQARKETDYDGPSSRTASSVVGSYSGTATDGHQGLVLVGMYGQFKFPERERASLLKGMREADGMSAPGPSRTIRPAGSDVELECTVLLSKDASGTATVPVCAWGDANTVGYVAFRASAADADTGQGPGSVDLDATAKQVLQVRAEARRPMG